MIASLKYVMCIDFVRCIVFFNDQVTPHTATVVTTGYLRIEIIKFEVIVIDVWTVAFVIFKVAIKYTGVVRNLFLSTVTFDIEIVVGRDEPD